MMKDVFLVEQKIRDQILTTLCHNIEATVSTLDSEADPDGGHWGARAFLKKYVF